MLATDVIIRKATRSDISEILQQRQRMYQDMNGEDSEALAAMASVSEPFLQKAIGEGSFHAWLAFSGERVAGGGAIIVGPWLSHPHDPNCRRATILNVYVYPDFRKRGIATQLMKTMICWCQKESFAVVYLHASQQGKPLYERLGFETGNEMRLKLR